MVRSPMKNLPSTRVFNIADPPNKHRLMRESLSALEPNPDLGFVAIHLVAAFIDGLASGPAGGTRDAYLEYLRHNFPDMCRAIGAEMFYSHIRNKAVHEFAVLPPFGLAHSNDLSDPSAHTESRLIDGKQWILINVERVLADFRSHLDSLDQAGNGKAGT